MRTSHIARTLLPAAALLALLGACQGTAPTVDARVSGTGTETVLVLPVGQEVGVFGSAVRLSLGGVRNDSRCPTDVMCFWEGDAEVEIGVRFGMGPTVPYAIHTALEPRSVDLDLYRITLVRLRPAPLSTIRIPPNEYVAEVCVRRLVTPAS